MEDARYEKPKVLLAAC